MNKESTAIGFGKRGRKSIEDPSKGHWTPFKIEVIEYLMDMGIKFSMAKIKNATDEKAEDYMHSLDTRDNYYEKEYQYKEEGTLKKELMKKWFVDKQGNYVEDVGPYRNKLQTLVMRYYTQIRMAGNDLLYLLRSYSSCIPKLYDNYLERIGPDGCLNFPGKSWGLHKNQSSIYNKKICKKLGTKGETDAYLWREVRNLTEHVMKYKEFYESKLEEDKDFYRSVQEVLSYMRECYDMLINILTVFDCRYNGRVNTIDIDAIERYLDEFTTLSQNKILKLEIKPKRKSEHSEIIKVGNKMYEKYYTLPKDRIKYEEAVLEAKQYAKEYKIRF